MRKIIVLCTALIAGCVAEPARIAETASGAPEVVLTKATARQIHAYFLTFFAENGWQIVSDHGVSISARHNMDSTKAAGKKFAASMISGKEGGMYEDELNVSLVTGNSGTRVILRLYTVVQWPGGQVERWEEEGNETFNDLQTALYKIRKESDGY